MEDLQTYLGRLAAEGATEEEIATARKQYLEAMMPTFNIGEFEDLLGKLEGSKMKQAQQKGRIDRRGTMSQGLASMMSNF